MAVAAAGLVLSSVARADMVLIINGASGTSEPGTTTAITNNLSSLHTAAGNVVTVADGVPGSLAGFQQVWDIRFSNNLAITAGQQAQYLSFLQGGGSLFAMGENASFGARNTSVLSLITAAGGGTLAFAVPPSTQTVLAPFTGPNPVSQVTYLAPGGVGVGAPGTGQFITAAGNQGTGLAFAPGTLTNAPAGRLSTIFDVNFMQGNVGQDSQNLLANLITFQQGGVVPEPSSIALLGLGVTGLLGYRWRRRPQPA